MNTALSCRNDTMERIWLNSLTHAYSIVWLYHTVAKCASCDAATPRRYHGTVYPCRARRPAPSGSADPRCPRAHSRLVRKPPAEQAIEVRHSLRPLPARSGVEFRVSGRGRGAVALWPQSSDAHTKWMAIEVFRGHRYSCRFLRHPRLCPCLESIPTNMSGVARRPEGASREATPVD